MKVALRIALGEGIAQAQGGGVDIPQTSPAKVLAGLEKALDQPLGGFIAAGGDGAAVLHLQRVATLHLLAHHHQERLHHVHRLETAHHHRHLIAIDDGQVDIGAGDDADVRGADKGVHLGNAVGHHRMNGGGHQHMVDMKQEVQGPLLFSGSQQGGRHRGGGLETDGEEDHGFVRILFGDTQGIEGVIDGADIAPLGALLGQRAPGARHPDHVPQGDQNDVGLAGQLDGLIDAFFWHDADRAAGTVDKLDAGGQQLVQAVLHDGVGMAAAHLHHPQWLGQIFGQFGDLGGEGADHLGLTKTLKQVIQGQHGKISCLGIRATIWRKLSRLACASSSSILLITKPIWSST